MVAVARVTPGRNVATTSKHELFNPKEHVPYHVTSMAAEAEKRYGKKGFLLRFDGPKPLVTSVAKFGRLHPPDTRAKSEALRYQKGQPMEAPPGQSLRTRAAIVGETKGVDPESRDPVIAVSEGPCALTTKKE